MVKRVTKKEAKITEEILEGTSTATDNVAATPKTTKPKTPRESNGKPRYADYVKDNFASIKAGNPELRPKDIMIKIGEKWRSEKQAKEKN